MVLIKPKLRDIRHLLDTLQTTANKLKPHRKLHVLNRLLPEKSKSIYALLGAGASLTAVGCLYQGAFWSGFFEVTDNVAVQEDDKYIYSGHVDQPDVESIVNSLWESWFIFTVKHFPWLSSTPEDVNFSLVSYLLLSPDPQLQTLGIQLISKVKTWKDYQYRLVRQESSIPVQVGLARVKNSDERWFLPMPDPPPLKNDLEEELSNLVLKLSDKGESVTRQQKTNRENVPLYINLDEEGLENARLISTVPEERTEINCLEKLVHLSMDPHKCQMITEQGGLLLLHHIINKRPNSLLVKQNVTRILANLCLDAKIGERIVKNGWISHVVKWLRCDNLDISLQAARLLSNLDKTSKDMFCDGVYLLHPIYSNSEPIAADIIFVHGLRGGAFKTWRQQDLKITRQEIAQEEHQKSQQSMNYASKVYDSVKKSFQSLWKHTDSQAPGSYTHCWPKDWLSEDIEDIRILGVDFEAELDMWAYEDEKQTLKAQGLKLIEKLKAANIGCRPVIWIGHSMGGLLIKQILVLSQATSGFEDLSRNTKGVCFISTPHKGSPLANEVSKISSQTEIKEMRTDSEVLKTLHKNFLHTVKKYEINCLSFGETEVTPILRGSLFNKLIVPPEFSDPGVGEFHTLKKNHLYICKPRDKDSDLYKWIVNFILRCIP